MSNIALYSTLAFFRCRVDVPLPPPSRPSSSLSCAWTGERHRPTVPVSPPILTTSKIRSNVNEPSSATELGMILIYQILVVLSMKFDFFKVLDVMAPKVEKHCSRIWLRYVFWVVWVKHNFTFIIFVDRSSVAIAASSNQASDVAESVNTGGASGGVESGAAAGAIPRSSSRRKSYHSSSSSLEHWKKINWTLWNNFPTWSTLGKWPPPLSLYNFALHLA